MNHLLLILRTLLFYAGYAGTLLIHAGLCVLLGWLLPLKTRYRVTVLWNHFAIWWLKLTCGVSYRISGIENIPREPFVLLSNHQSPWETLFLYDHFCPLCATLKRELLYIPFFGWALFMLDPIAIDRSKRTGARQILLREGRKRLQAGISVLVFPEGTRVAPGQERKYSTGGAELAITAGVPVLPVAHNAGCYWPAHRYLKTPGTVEVVIGAPLATAGREARELTEEVQAWTRQTLNQLGR
jgi:1-acyl-sn-glycerol-3-phosphate acyltransferase